MEPRVYEHYHAGTRFSLDDGKDEVVIGTLIGGGGTSLVYKGESSRWGGAAVKVLNPRRGANGGVYRGTMVGMTQSFRRECATLSRLVSVPGVAHLLWAGTIPVRSGYTLVHITSELEPVATSSIGARVKELDEVLSGLHRIGIVHLDLKPQNIMEDAANRLSLIDFGSSMTLSDLRGGPLSLWTSRLHVQGTRFEGWLDRSFGVDDWPDLVRLDRFLLNRLESAK